MKSNWNMFYLAKMVYYSQISLVMMNLNSSFVIDKTQNNYTGSSGVKANYTNFNIKFIETYWAWFLNNNILFRNKLVYKSSWV